MTVTASSDGTELITFYRSDLPQLAILLDTLNDSHPEAHRFRQVWSLTYARPNWKQRLAAAIPFFYHRSGGGDSSKAPSPLIDLSDPTRGTARRLAGAIVQSGFLDSYGALIRAPTRSYRGSALDYRNMSLVRSLKIVDEDAAPPALPDELSAEDWDAVRGRLLLARKLLGNFVSTERASSAAAAESTRDYGTRAANWDLLRQTAEGNGLYVSALHSPSETGPPRHAVLWFKQNDGGQAPATPFKSGFLRISDPFRDARLRQWTGYSATWPLDSEGVVCESACQGTQRERMIPLAIYALDYPRVPLLLADFRSDRAKRREILRHAADDVATGVFGITPYSSLSWFTARASFLWVRDRHGAAMNRSARLASYALLRQELLDLTEASAQEMDPAFHRLLANKLDALALNPFEQSTEQEKALAPKQYATLTRSLASGKFSRGLARDRAREYARSVPRSAKAPGLPNPELFTALARQRRLEAAPNSVPPQVQPRPASPDIIGAGQ